jgi:hypothetical protein
MTQTCRGDTQLLVGLDTDDPALDAYERIPGVEYLVEEGLRFVVPWINALAVPRAEEYRFIGTIGDDNLPETVGWDARVIDSLSDPDTLFCFADDRYPGRATGSLCCHVFMQSKVIQSLGYMAWPGVRHMYSDPIWMAWGQATKIEFLADVMIPHLHYSAGLSDVDESYAASTALIPADCAAYNEYCNSAELNRDIERIKAGAKGFDPEELREWNHDLNIPRIWGEPA